MKNKFISIPLIGAWCLSIVLSISFFVELPKYLPIDDSYIVLQYAKNVIEHGEFFSYNTGELSTGITSPLYCLSIALGKVITGDWNYSVYLIGFLSFLLALISGSYWAWNICSGKEKHGELAAILFSIFWGCWGYMYFFVFSGLEPMMHVALCFLALSFYSIKKYFYTGLSLGAAALCRPETVFLLFLIGLPIIYDFIILLKHNSQQAKESFISGAKIILGFFAIYGIWMIRCLQISGSVFSSTVFMKTDPQSFIEIKEYLRAFITLLSPNAYDYSLMTTMTKQSGWMFLRSICPFGIVFLFCIVFLCKKKPYWIPFLYPIVHFLFTFTKNCMASGNMRYHVFDFSIMMVGLAILISNICLCNKQALKTFGYVSAFILCGLIIDDNHYQKNLYNMLSNYYYRLDYSIGELFQTSPEDTRIALYQAGGIKFFSQRYIIDCGGVTDHTIFKYVKGENKNIPWAIVDRDADYVAPMGNHWLSEWGIWMNNTNLFEQIPMNCRGLYKVKKKNLKDYLEKNYSHK